MIYGKVIFFDYNIRSNQQSCEVLVTTSTHISVISFTKLTKLLSISYTTSAGISVILFTILINILTTYYVDWKEEKL